MRYQLKIFYLLLFTLILPSICLSQGKYLFSYQRKIFKLDLKDSVNSVISLKASIGDVLPAYEIFDLSNEPRIVIDLFSKDLFLSREFEIPQNAYIKQLRIGSHPDKLRIVLDLNTAVVPAYHFESAANQLILKIGQIPEAKVQKKAVEQVVQQSKQIIAKPLLLKAKALTSTPPKPSFIEPVVPAINQPTLLSLKLKKSDLSLRAPEPEESILEEKELKQPILPAVTELEPKVPDDSSSRLAQTEIPEGQALQKIVFEFKEEENLPLVKLDLTLHPSFNIIKLKNNRYRLTVPDCKLAGKHLALPYFPPHNFIGFTMIEAEQKRNSCQVTVTADKNSSISAFTRQNAIFLKALKKTL